MRLGDLLKKLREDRGYSKAYLAKKLGIGSTFIMQVERNMKKLTDRRCNQIIEILNLTTAEKKEFLNAAVLERSKGRTRSILEKVLNQKTDIIEISQNTEFDRVPLLGACPASNRTWVADEVESWHPFPKDVIKGRKFYLLRVKGDSMNRAGIDNGDLVLVAADREPVNGNIVVICVDHEYTMKRFYKQDNLVNLMPESTNPEHKPCMIDVKKVEVMIRGVVEMVYLKKLR